MGIFEIIPITLAFVAATAAILVGINQQGLKAYEAYFIAFCALASAWLFESELLFTACWAMITFTSGMSLTLRLKLVDRFKIWQMSRGEPKWRVIEWDVILGDHVATIDEPDQIRANYWWGVSEKDRIWPFIHEGTAKSMDEAVVLARDAVNFWKPEDEKSKNIPSIIYAEFHKWSMDISRCRRTGVFNYEFYNLDWDSGRMSKESEWGVTIGQAENLDDAKIGVHAMLINYLESQL